MLFGSIALQQQCHWYESGVGFNRHVYQYHYIKPFESDLKMKGGAGTTCTIVKVVFLLLLLLSIEGFELLIVGDGKELGKENPSKYDTL